MDQGRAGALLKEERARLERLLAASSAEEEPSRASADGVGDEVDDADRRVTGETAMAAGELLRDRLAALERAEERLAAGTYGRSVQSGRPIPDERLEADPLAELTVAEAEQAAAGRFGGTERSDAAGLASARHPYEVLADADLTPEEELASEEEDDEPSPQPSLGVEVEPEEVALGGDPADPAYPLDPGDPADPEDPAGPGDPLDPEDRLDRPPD